MKPLVKDNNITEVLKYVCSLTGLYYQEETSDWYERAYYDYTPTTRIAIVNDGTHHLKVNFKLGGEDLVYKYDCSDWSVNELVDQIGAYQKQVKAFFEDIELDKIKDDFK
jgi:hypothetical protein